MFLNDRTITELLILLDGSIFNLRTYISLQEAIVVLEVFITSIKSITKAREHASVTEEIETRRESTFKVAVAFEEFALNYSKLHLIGTRFPQVIDSHKMGESEHNMVYRP